MSPTPVLILQLMLEHIGPRKFKVNRNGYVPFRIRLEADLDPPTVRGLTKWCRSYKYS